MKSTGTNKVNTSKREFITSDELKASMKARIEKMYESRKQVITEEDIRNGISGSELIAAVCKRIDRFADK